MSEFFTSRGWIGHSSPYVISLQQPLKWSKRAEYDCIHVKLSQSGTDGQYNNWTATILRCIGSEMFCVRASTSSSSMGDGYVGIIVFTSKPHKICDKKNVIYDPHSWYYTAKRKHISYKNWPPRYNSIIIENGIKHHSIYSIAPVQQNIYLTVIYKKIM